MVKQRTDDAPAILGKATQWPVSVWGLKSPAGSYVGMLMNVDHLWPHLEGWSAVLCSRESLIEFYKPFSTAMGESAFVGRIIEIETHEVIEWAHPKAAGVMLVERDGSEIARIEK